MNVFILSPGRTATTTFSEAFSNLSGYTASHESRTRKLGEDRVDYPNNHIECDNRLVWFLPRLSDKYCQSSVLVKVVRDKEKIAKSYNKRWYKINIMKAYSQGILLRDLSENGISVCRDYVENVYEQIDAHKVKWKSYVEINLDDPEEGVKELLKILNREESLDDVLNVMRSSSLNQNKSGVYHKISVAYFNVRVLLKDLVA